MRKMFTAAVVALFAFAAIPALAADLPPLTFQPRSAIASQHLASHIDEAICGWIYEPGDAHICAVECPTLLLRDKHGPLLQRPPITRNLARQFQPGERIAQGVDRAERANWKHRAERRKSDRLLFSRE